MNDHDHRDDSPKVVALTEFSVHYENGDLELAERAWHLATDRFADYDVNPRDADEELEIGAE